MADLPPKDPDNLILFPRAAQEPASEGPAQADDSPFGSLWRPSDEVNQRVGELLGSLYGAVQTLARLTLEIELSSNSTSFTREADAFARATMHAMNRILVAMERQDLLPEFDATGRLQFPPNARPEKEPV